MDELISVIVPVYRVEEYLGRCMDSVLAQDYANYEVILVDDGSDDGCPAMCDSYAAADERVRVIHQENMGLSGARNSGIDAARGGWISFIDSDDYITEDFLSTLHAACVESGSVMAVCRWEYVQGGAIPQSGDGRLEVRSGQDMLSMLYGQDGAYYVVAWNKLYRKELFGEIRYPCGRIHEDEATTYKLYDLAEKAVYVDRALYGYFVAPQSITRGFNLKRTDWVKAQAERMDYFESKGYTQLMVPGLKAFFDGAIDIYFGLVDHVPEASREQQEEIKTYIRQGFKRVRAYGRFHLRTWIGYRLFLSFPLLYRRLLDRVKDENGKQ